MSFTAALAIYFIMWFGCLFLVLPFYANHGDDRDVAPIVGQADSAPPHFPVWQVIGRVSLLTAILFGVYYANYVFGWLTVDSVNFLRGPVPATAD